MLPRAIFLLLTLAVVQPGIPQTRSQAEKKLRPPMSKREQDLKFHKPDVRGTDTLTRVRGYEQRLRMEADSPFGNIKWRNIGPTTQGGRVVEIHVATER